MNPPDLTLREKEASVVRGEMKIRDKRSVTVRYLRVRAESMLDSKGIDSSTMYILLFGKTRARPVRWVVGRICEGIVESEDKCPGKSA